MRFANIAPSLITLTLLSAVWSPQALAQDTWFINGQPTIVFANPERTRQAQTKLQEIVSSLDPHPNWTVDVFVPPHPTPPPQLAIVRLQGQPLIEVRPADATFAKAPSVVALANQWATTLKSLFSQPNVRYFLVITYTLPSQVIYQGRTYVLCPKPATDRGLFRTNGKRVDNRVIFWEIPADQRAYVVSDTLPPEPNQPATIYLLHQQRFFVPYQQKC